MENESIKIFIAYARKDGEMLEELRKHFNPLEKSGKIAVWYDGEIKPGEKWDEIIQQELYCAEIILLLVSSDSISSTYFYENEVQKAIERSENGEIRVIPVILRRCLWQETPIGKLQALPENGQPINEWLPIDTGYFNVVTSVNEIVRDLLVQRHLAKNNDNNSKKYGTIQFIDSNRIRVEYTGEIFNGKANGLGTAKALGDNPYYEYRGHYVNNLRHDENAKMIWGSGDKYEGGFQNDKKHGKGSYHWDGENEYVGNFLEDGITGNGIYKTKKFIYEGELERRSFHRKGKLIELEKKYTYEGDFWEGKKVGKGKIIYENGLIYEGDFLDDLAHGLGRRILPNGVIYEGEFRKGKAHGKGQMFTDRLNIYEGLFIEDKVETDTLIVDEHGNKFEYKNKDRDEKKREGKVTFYNGDIFEGEGKYYGGPQFRGLYIYPNGIKIKMDYYTPNNDQYFHYIIEEIEFANGILVTVENRLTKKEEKSDLIVLGCFAILEINIANIINNGLCRWLNGKLTYLKIENYFIDWNTGELHSKNNNKIESDILDKKPLEMIEPVKLKKWWSKLTLKK